MLAPILLAMYSSAAAEAGVLTSTAELNDACSSFRHGAQFAITTLVEHVSTGLKGKTLLTVQSNGTWSFLSVPGSGGSAIRPGDTVFVRGYTKNSSPAFDIPIATEVLAIGHGAPSPLRKAKLGDILDGKHDYAIVLVDGTVTDAFDDEIDSRYFWLSLTDGDNTIYVCHYEHYEQRKMLASLVGADVEVKASVTASSHGLRLKLKKTLSTTDPVQIRTLAPPSKDPFLFPWRKRRQGMVLAKWQGHSVLLRCRRAHHICRVEFAGKELPDVGRFVEVAGTPTTDLYNDNLTRAIWRPAEAWPEEERRPLDIDPDTILKTSYSDGYTGINPKYHGSLIRLTGQVREDVDNSGRILLGCGGHIIPVDASSAPDARALLEPGCRASVVGVCVMDVPNWVEGGPFPRISGFTLVVRSASDVDVVSRPPWWTPMRLVIVIGILAAVVLLVLLWNAALRAMVARRSRQLIQEQAQKIGAELRIDERTRLAAELHDSVAQNLSSVSMQLDAAQIAAQDLPERFRSLLNLASKTLLSCRQELRNCLWDLRGQALDEPNLDEAVAKTLRPHLSGAILRVRFNVPRQLVSDQTTHAILRILRELASNAVRHGRARSISVAGCLDGRKVMFSMVDDGVGFDPSAAGGADTGHFGLSGIRDRVNKLHGTFDLSSAPGRGTRAIITLNT